MFIYQCSLRVPFIYNAAYSLADRPGAEVVTFLEKNNFSKFIRKILYQNAWHTSKVTGTSWVVCRPVFRGGGFNQGRINLLRGPMPCDNGGPFRKYSPASFINTALRPAVQYICGINGRAIGWSSEIKYLGIFLVSAGVFRCSFCKVKQSNL